MRRLLIACTLILAAGCGDDTTAADAGAPAGTERGPCLPGDVCKPGLTCASAVCVKLVLDSGADAGQPDSSIDSTGMPDAPPPVPDVLLKFDLPAPKKVVLCGCKHSGGQPFCDGSHNHLDDRA